MSFMFERLDVYQKGLEFVNKIMTTSDKLPKGNYFLVDQIKRAALSIPLNIAEGNGRWHKKDRKQFFIIARGSCFECVPVLQLMKDRKLISSEEHANAYAELEVIGKMINALITSLEN